jgi:hypothetical protein
MRLAWYFAYMEKRQLIPRRVSRKPAEGKRALDQRDHFTTSQRTDRVGAEDSSRLYVLEVEWGGIGRVGGVEFGL